MNQDKIILKKEAQALYREKENEVTWNKINKLFEILISNFITKDDVQLHLYDFENLLFRSLLSERSKLNGTCIQFLLKCNDLDPDYDFIEYIPVLIKLGGKSNRIFVQRAEHCLLQLIKNIDSSKLLRIIELHIQSNNKKVREILFKIIEIKVSTEKNMFNMIVDKGLTDPAIEVRNLAKKIKTLQNQVNINKQPPILHKKTGSYQCKISANSVSNIGACNQENKFIYNKLDHKILLTDKKKFNYNKNEIRKCISLTNMKMEECNNSLIEALEAVDRSKHTISVTCDEKIPFNTPIEDGNLTHTVCNNSTASNFELKSNLIVSKKIKRSLENLTNELHLLNNVSLYNCNNKVNCENVNNKECDMLNIFNKPVQSNPELIDHLDGKYIKSNPDYSKKILVTKKSVPKSSRSKTRELNQKTIPKNNLKKI